MTRHTLPALLAFAACGAAAERPEFAWTDPEGERPVLTYGGNPVLEYVRPKFDPKAVPDKKEVLTNPTIKVYHHLYSPIGKGIRLTNGPEGRYPHHRGIFYGFNRVSYDGQQADVWHCRNGESQQHVATLSHDAGPDAGRHKVKVSWNGRDGKPFATEERELVVSAPKGVWQVDFSSVLTTDRDRVRLDGDPQHAGFHFRAAQDVEKNEKETYFLRPEGKGEKGEEVNWVAKPKGKSVPSGPVNRPWTAMSFVVGGKRYTCLYLDHPDNPKEARQSERAYGRVGTYFEYDLTKDKPLKVRYRLWAQEGEVTAEQCEELSKAFVGK
jgi:Methane oxygenase PmoA